jgi:hypothetical protein
VFAELQGGKFWNGFAAGAGGAAAGFLGNELGKYLEDIRAEQKEILEKLDLSNPEDVKWLKKYGIGKIRICYDENVDNNKWNELLRIHEGNKLDGIFEWLKTRDFDKNAIIKVGKMHIRLGTDKMIENGAYGHYEKQTNYITVHFDRFDVVLNPIVHLLFDSAYQGILGVK